MMKNLFKKIRAFFGKSNTNLIVAGSALFVSTCALFISVKEVEIMRTQQKATMYPYITIGTTYNGEGFGFVLKNSGNGLARINSYQVYNDSIHFREWLDVLETYMPDAENINYGLINTAGNIRNQMIAPGESKNLIFLKWTPETRALEKRIQTLQIGICYSSLLDEHWNVVDGIPVAIETPCIAQLEKEFGF